MRKSIEGRILEMAGVQASSPEFGRCPFCEEVLKFNDEVQVECPKCGMIVDLEVAKEKLAEVSDQIKL